MQEQHDPNVHIGPLSDEIIAHLTAALGQPKSHFLTISEGRDIHALGWTIGIGRLRDRKSMIPGSAERGTDVEIIALKSGNLVTTRRTYSRGSTENIHAATGRVNSTPQAAYNWLLEDGNGKLGPASKQAWVQACQQFPPMKGLEYEVAE